MSVRDPPKQCYLLHWSHLALEMAARACLGAAGVSGRAVWACFGVARALKMAAQSRQCSHLALEIASRACPGAGGAPGRAVWACFGVARALKTAAQSCQCTRKGQGSQPVLPARPPSRAPGPPACCQRGLPAWPRACQPCQESLRACAGVPPGPASKAYKPVSCAC